MAKIKKFAGKSLTVVTLMAAVVMCVMCLDGCGKGIVKVDTVLTMTEDFAGSRHMEIEIPQSVLKKYVSASWDEIVSLLLNNCPEQLECSTERTTAGYILEYDIEFSSLDEYKSKIEALLGRPAEISADTPDTVFASGIIIQEDFTSADLLKYIPEAANEAGYISADYKDGMIKNGKNTAVYGGHTYKISGEYISVNNIKSLAINSVTINTNVTADRTFDRKIIIDIPKESMDINGEAIKGYLEGNLPEGMEGKWKESSKKYTFSAEIKDKSAEMLQAFTAAVLDDAGCTVSYGDSSEDGDILSVVLKFNENIDLSAFTSEADGLIPLKYSFNIEELYDVAVEKSINGQEMQSVDVGNLADKQLLVDEGVKQLGIQISMNRHYEAGSIKAITNISENKEISREFIFTVSGSPTEFEKDIISSRFRQTAESFADVETKEDNRKFSLILRMRGSEYALEESFNGLFHKDGSIHYEAKNEGVGDSDSFLYGENLDFSDFMSYSDNVTVKYELNAEKVKFDRNSLRVEAEAIKDIDVNSKGVSCTVYGTQINMQVIGHKADNIVVWIIMLIVVIVVFAGIILALIVYRKKSENREDKDLPVPVEDEFNLNDEF